MQVSKAQNWEERIPVTRPDKSSPGGNLLHSETASPEHEKIRNANKRKMLHRSDETPKTKESTKNETQKGLPRRTLAHLKLISVSNFTVSADTNTRSCEQAQTTRRKKTKRVS